MIPYGRQDISEDDIRAVVEVLRSPFLTQGPAVERFEAALAEVVGAQHVVAVANGTASLHLAALALDLGPGDRLWTVPNTYVATANAALYCGAEADFVDIHPRTLDIDVEALARKLEVAEREGTLPKVVAPVHFSGRAYPTQAVHELSKRYGFRIVEDAAHAIGTLDGDTPIGACEHSDVVSFSFHPVKLITTGEGGALSTNDDALADRLRRLRSHGVTRDPAHMVHEPEGAWYFELVELGLNYRLTDLQAALGTSQLARLETFVARRNELAARYDELLADLPLERPAPIENGRSAFHLYVVQVPHGVDRAALFANLREAGVGVQVHFIPVHLHPLYRKKGFAPGDFPVSEAYYERALTLPLFAAMTDDEQDRVVEQLSLQLAGARA